MIVNCTLF